MKTTNRAILLVNLGSPNQPTTKALRPYLRQFLMDKRVLAIPWIIRALLVHFFIVPRRSSQSAAAYKKIWTKQGSPLVVHTEKLAKALARQTKFPVYWAMRYGQPAIEKTLREMRNKAITRIFCIPLYPHYAMSSYETAKEEVERQAKRSGLRCDFLPPFYNHPHYIEALESTVKAFLKQGDHILFSYHGLPVRHLYRTGPKDSLCLKEKNCCDISHPGHPHCYLYQIKKTTTLLAKKLKLKEANYSFAFQSRLQGKWLQPFTDKEIVRLAQSGIKHLLVLCPSFVSDCLETLEEIGIRAKEDFRAHRGESLTLVPCLNEHPCWVEFLSSQCQLWAKID